jgi:hypothetical protein
LRRAGGHFADIRGRSGPGLALADDGSTRLTDKEIKKTESVAALAAMFSGSLGNGLS